MQLWPVSGPLITFTRLDPCHLTLRECIDMAKVAPDTTTKHLTTQILRHLHLGCHSVLGSRRIMLTLLFAPCILCFALPANSAFSTGKSRGVFSALTSVQAWRRNKTAPSLLMTWKNVLRVFSSRAECYQVRETEAWDLFMKAK